MFDTPGLEYGHHRHTNLHVRTGALSTVVQAFSLGGTANQRGSSEAVSMRVAFTARTAKLVLDS